MAQTADRTLPGHDAHRQHRAPRDPNAGARKRRGAFFFLVSITLLLLSLAMILLPMLTGQAEPIPTQPYRELFGLLWQPGSRTAGLLLLLASAASLVLWAWITSHDKAPDDPPVREIYNAYTMVYTGGLLVFLVFCGTVGLLTSAAVVVLMGLGLLAKRFTKASW